MNPVRRRRWLLGALVLGLSWLPLVGTLGYEHAFVLSPIVSLLGMAVGVDAVRRGRALPDPRPVADALGELARLLGVALALSVLALAWQTNCDPWSGLLFFAMGPAASGVVGVAAGLWGGVLASTRKRQLLLGASVFVASTAIGAWRLIADPVVFAYDPFWGYFSGAIYDEDVGIRRVFVLFRAYNALGVVAALGLLTLVVDPQALALRRGPALLDALRRDVRRTALVVGATVLAIGIGLTGPRWGFTANIETITATLSGIRQTEHFTIHYNPRSADAREIDAIALEHELAWARLSRLMDGREPAGKVRSFLFGSPGQKRALMGAGTVQVAAPWRSQIYLDHRSFPHPVLHHELAHVFGRTIGDPLFGVARSGLHINIALIEGFATAMAPRAADHLDLHDQALILDRLERRPSLPAIMGPSFFTESSRVAYTTAGSFCLWLIETRGFSGMADLYGTAGDFQGAYGESLPALETQWLAFLRERGGVTEQDVESQRQRFMRRSVFRRPCAHRAANLAAEISGADRKGRHEEAVALYQTLCAIEPEDPEHRIGLAWAQAVTGDFAGALASLAQAATADDLTVTLQAALLSRRADVALAAGDLDQAARASREALALPMDRGARRTHELRLVAAEDPALAPLVLAYLAPFDADAEGTTAGVRRLFAAVTIAGAPGYRALGSYLVARQLLNAQDPAAAVPLLQVALAPGDAEPGLPSADFVRAAHEALLSASVQAGQMDLARATLASFANLPDAGHGDALEAQDWRERIEFFATHTAGG